MRNSPVLLIFSDLTTFQELRVENLEVWIRPNNVFLLPIHEHPHLGNI